MKALIFATVSTQEQETDGHSIDNKIISFASKSLKSENL